MKACLVLEDGRVFTGRAFGAAGEVSAEVVFNTGMAGYQEVLTDPSYAGQIVAMTYPLIGNYGINAEDNESDRIQVSGLVVRELCRWPSNFRSEKSLNDWLKEQNIIGIEDVDTRALTRHIREAGSMNGVLSTLNKSVEELARQARAAAPMAGQDLVKQVTCAHPWDFNLPGAPLAAHRTIVVIDCGAKSNIYRELAQRGCRVRVAPATATAAEILALHPDGVLISNGPGDPAALHYLIDTVKALIGRLPIFGICLGHQIVGLAFGGKTAKMKFGHRGVNHPVKDLTTGRVAITSQNHGFCVLAESLPSTVEVTHLNLNDQTTEGLRHRELPIFTVQHHPEASPGPHDATPLFDRFVSMVDQHKK